MKRSDQISRLSENEVWDILVIGGGASGLGVALDAVSRGLRVCLVEKHDFGKGTSSRSTKLVHGGVRYLEQGNIRLVREALKERKYILNRAPHVSAEQAFIVPCYSWWSQLYYFFGLFFYGLLSGSYQIGRTQWLSRNEAIRRLPNIKQAGLIGGVLYWDGVFDDARFCVDLVSTIIQHGGVCINYAGVESLLIANDKIRGARVRDYTTGEELNIQAQVVVNATGIFSDEIVKMEDASLPTRVVLSRGTHIVLDRYFLDSDDAIMIPKTSDGRVLFIIPWMNRVLVGTTDLITSQTELEPKPTNEEIQFILQNVQHYLKEKPALHDIRSLFAGLRPLAASSSNGQKTKEISRGHQIRISEQGLVSIIGGKWTTFRRMGQDVVDKVAHHFSLAYADSTSASMDILNMSKSNSTGELIHDELPVTWDMIERAIENTMVERLEDLLCRRTRCAFIDSAATWEVAPKVGKLLQQKRNRSDQWYEEQMRNVAIILSNFQTEQKQYSK